MYYFTCRKEVSGISVKRRFILFGAKGSKEGINPFSFCEKTNLLFVESVALLNKFLKKYLICEVSNMFG